MICPIPENEQRYTKFYKTGIRQVSIDDFTFRDDILVWTTRLFAHSVDIFINSRKRQRFLFITMKRKKLGMRRETLFQPSFDKARFDVVSDTEEDFSVKT